MSFAIKSALFFSLTILSASLGMPALGATKVLSSAVGQVKDHVVTSREVQINQGIEQLLYVSKTGKVKIPKDVDSSSFSKLVTAVLLEWVVYFEARTMNSISNVASEVSQAESKVKKNLSKDKAWKDLHATAQEIKFTIERKLLAKKFIRFRADSSVVPVTDSEAQRYFEQNQQKFGNLPFEKFSAGIKSYLTRQQVEKRLKDWFEVLQAKYQVRNFLAEI